MLNDLVGSGHRVKNPDGFHPCLLACRLCSKSVLTSCRNRFLRHWKRKLSINGERHRTPFLLLDTVIIMFHSPASGRETNIKYPVHNKKERIRRTGTVHTSAKACLASVAIRIRIRLRISESDRHKNLTFCSLSHCQPFLKISCKSFRKFLRKVADRQTNRQGPAAKG